MAYYVSAIAHNAINHHQQLYDERMLRALYAAEHPTFNPSGYESPWYEVWLNFLLKEAVLYPRFGICPQETLHGSVRYRTPDFVLYKYADGVSNQNAPIIRSRRVRIVVEVKTAIAFVTAETLAKAFDDVDDQTDVQAMIAFQTLDNLDHVQHMYILQCVGRYWRVGRMLKAPPQLTTWSATADITDPNASQVLIQTWFHSNAGGIFA
jgi:hypothetical protein